MKSLFRILFIIIIFSPGTVCLSQNVVSASDSMHIVRKNDKSVDESRKQKHTKKKRDQGVEMGQADQNQGNNGPGNNNPDNRDPVKRVNSARPDMTRMKGGARPPDILRPSGPLLPRGIGKPGGAFRPGGH